MLVFEATKILFFFKLSEEILANALYNINVYTPCTHFFLLNNSDDYFDDYSDHFCIIKMLLNILNDSLDYHEFEKL